MRVDFLLKRVEANINFFDETGLKKERIELEKKIAAGEVLLLKKPDKSQRFLITFLSLIRFAKRDCTRCRMSITK